MATDRRVTDKSLKNLKSFKKGERTSEQAVAAGRLGGLKAQKNKRERKKMCDLLKEYLNQESELHPDKTVGEEYIAAVVAQLICNPNIKDLESITRILGEMRQQIEVNADIKAKAELFKLPDGE